VKSEDRSLRPVFNVSFSMVRPAGVEMDALNRLLWVEPWEELEPLFSASPGVHS
jgi:hypothetical protein